jgi:hypothetical protein
LKGSNVEHTEAAESIGWSFVAQNWQTVFIFGCLVLVFFFVLFLVVFTVFVGTATLVGFAGTACFVSLTFFTCVTGFNGFVSQFMASMCGIM